MIPPIEIMKQAYGQQDPPFTGSISELIVQEELAAAQDQIQEQEALDIAVTPQEQQVGLTQGPPRPMVFPDTQGQDFNTMGMDYPIDIQGFDNEGGLVRSYEAVPPGIDSIPMGPKVSTVIENPTQYKKGGMSNLSFAEKIERYKKLRNEKRQNIS